MTPYLIGLGVAAALLIAPLIIMAIMSKTMKPATRANNGDTRPPPWAGSMAEGSKYVAPIPAETATALQERWQALQTYAGQRSGWTIVTWTDSYAHIEARTPLLGFVDDMECWLNSTDLQIDIRSSSRIGGSDFGANSKRLSELVEAANDPKWKP